MSLRWTSFVVPKPPKGGSKTQSVQDLNNKLRYLRNGLSLLLLLCSVSARCVTAATWTEDPGGPPGTTERDHTSPGNVPQHPPGRASSPLPGTAFASATSRRQATDEQVRLDVVVCRRRWTTRRNHRRQRQFFLLFGVARTSVQLLLYTYIITQK